MTDAELARTGREELIKRIRESGKIGDDLRSWSLSALVALDSGTALEPNSLAHLSLRKLFDAWETIDAVSRKGEKQ